MTQPDTPESALSPAEEDVAAETRARAERDRVAVIFTDVPPPVSTVINLQRARRRIE